MLAGRGASHTCARAQPPAGFTVHDNAAHTVCLRACVGMALHAKHSTPLHYCCNTPQQRSTAKRLKPPLRQWAGHTPAMHACMHMHVPVGDSTPPHGS